MSEPRLRHLFDALTNYEGESAIVSSGDTRRMWGQGIGDVSGERLTGRISWCNHARRNAAGVWHPDLHGFIQTNDGALILVDIEGYSVPNDDDTERQLRCTVRFHTDSSKYDWLNYAVAVVAGSFDPKAGASTFKVYEVEG